MMYAYCTSARSINTTLTDVIAIQGESFKQNNYSFAPICNNYMSMVVNLLLHAKDRNRVNTKGIEKGRSEKLVLSTFRNKNHFVSSY